MTEVIARVGNLTKDPVINEVNGKKVANFTLAQNYRIGSGDDAQEHTRYLECSFWEKGAERAEEKLKAGDQVVITDGFVHTVTTDKDGKTYTNHQLRNANYFYKVDNG